MKVPIKKLHKDAVIPTYANPGDAAQDMTSIGIEVDKYGNKSYKTGIAMAIPLGYVGLLFPRSSISKYTLSLANAVGVVDSGYRGEIFFKFKPTPYFNQQYNPETFDLYHRFEHNVQYNIGDRIGQIMIIERPDVDWDIVDDFDDTERGDGGFGSTGS